MSVTEVSINDFYKALHLSFFIIILKFLHETHPTFDLSKSKT